MPLVCPCPRLPPPAADIYERTAQELAQQGLDCECLGGGRLAHRPAERKIHVYGYSVVSRSGSGGGPAGAAAALRLSTAAPRELKGRGRR